MASFTIFGQTPCDQNFVKVKVDSSGCKSVEMGQHRFAQFYYAEKHLGEIQDSLPELKNKLKTEKAQTDSIEANLNAEIDTLNATNTIMKVSLEDCEETGMELQVDNLYLQSALDDEKKRRKWWFIGGGVTVILVDIAVNILKQ